MILFYEVLKQYGLKGKIQITPISSRPDRLMDDMPYGARHYKFSVSIGGKRFSGYYSAGPGIKISPNEDDIFASLISDAGSYSSSRDFNDFVSEFGYDIYDSKSKRKAMRIYNAVKKTHDFLSNAFSGNELSKIWEMYSDAGKL